MEIVPAEIFNGVPDWLTWIIVIILVVAAVIIIWGFVRTRTP
jgi:uncharacterized membrane protein YecN with MAPEG domain